MNKQFSELETTSRRRFLKWSAAAGLITPLLALTSCNNGQGQNSNSANNISTPRENQEEVPTISQCDPSGLRSHLPPIIIGDESSTKLEVLNKLETAAASPPFIYKEEAATPADKRYGALNKVRVLTEITSDPYLTDITYFGLPPNSQLLIWYQKIKDTSTSPSDCDFDMVVFDPKNPDVRIKGAGGGDSFSVTLRHKKFDSSGNSHKCDRPFRYKQETVPGFGRFFRIGQWRIVGADGVTAVQSSTGVKFEGMGDQAYTLFAHFH